MFTQRVTVHYVDGTTHELVLDQWSIGQFAAYATKMGWQMDMEKPGILAVLMLRIQAWAQLHRDPAMPRPQFEAWDRTVSEVEPTEESEQVDPTQPVP